MRRIVLALLVVPLASAGTLVAHGVAYAVLGGPAEGVHGYLAHLPQLAAIVALPALLLAAIAGRAAAPRAWPVAVAALAAFVLQEHAERLAHTGELPFLLDTPVFLLGLVLQVPFALGAWLLARTLWRAAAEWAPRRLSRVPQLLLPVAAAPAAVVLGAQPIASCSPRGPPALLRAR